MTDSTSSYDPAHVMVSAYRSAEGDLIALTRVCNTVDVKNATWKNTSGAPELIAVWKDPQFRSQAAGVLLRTGHRDTDTTLDGVRGQAVRHHDAGQRANDHAGAGLHLADLVHALGPEGTRFAIPSETSA